MRPGSERTGGTLCERPSDEFTQGAESRALGNSNTSLVSQGQEYRMSIRKTHGKDLHRARAFEMSPMVYNHDLLYWGGFILFGILLGFVHCDSPAEHALNGEFHARRQQWRAIAPPKEFGR
jgi:hypothetical protein